MRGQYLFNAIYSTPWAVLPEKLAVILAVAQRHALGERLDPAEVQAITQAAATRQQTAGRGAVAVIPVVGTLIPRGDMLLESSGAVSAQRVTAGFRAALADQQVGSIVLDIDSPGGSVAGIEELAGEIYAARGQKPIVAVANTLAASAAYWLAAAAGELVVSPSAEVGSIGVFAAHTDLSAAYEQAGVKMTLVAAGKYKTEGSPYAPLDDAARAAIQGRVNDYYDAFTKAVARGRGVNVADVRGGFGEGRVVGAKEAVKLGMADRVDTLDGTIARLMKGGGRGAARAEAQRMRDRLALLDL